VTRIPSILLGEVQPKVPNVACNEVRRPSLHPCKEYRNVLFRQGEAYGKFSRSRVKEVNVPSRLGKPVPVHVFREVDPRFLKRIAGRAKNRALQLPELSEPRICR
jgi:hypothetical protein